MITVLIDLHGELGGLDWCLPFLYPAEAEGRLIRLPVARPVFAPNHLAAAADDVRARLIRRHERHWQLVCILAVDGAPRGPRPGPVAGQLHQIRRLLLDTFHRHELAPQAVWAVADDGVEREAVTAQPLSARTHALWQHDRNGWIDETGPVSADTLAALGPAYFSRGDLDRLQDGSDTDALFHDKRQALSRHAEDAEALPYTTRELDRLQEALLEPEGDVRTLLARHLGLAGLPAPIRLLRLPHTGDKAPPCRTLHLVQLLQVLIEERRATDWFEQPAEGPFRAYACTQVEMEHDAFRSTLEAYHIHLEDTRRRLDRATRTTETVERRSEEGCDAAPVVQPPALDTRTFGRFHDIEHRIRWQQWLDATRQALDQHDRSLRQAIVDSMKRTMDAPRVLTTEDNAPLEDILAGREEAYAQARAAAFAHPRQPFPSLDLKVRLEPLTRRIRARLQRLPSQRRFWLTLLVVFVVVALPYAVLAYRIGARVDRLALPLALLGVAALTAFVTLYRLHRPLRRDAEDARRVAQGHSLNVSRVAGRHLAYVADLCRLRIARENADTARAAQRATEAQRLKARYHAHTIDRHLEDTARLLRTCLPAATKPGAIDPNPALQDAPRTLERDTPDLAFYAPQTHASHPAPDYELRVDTALKTPEHPVPGLHTFTFIQDPCFGRFAEP